ncbi:accessory Sec system glycosylation chaperone GtfB [Mammaliicoccus sciuri]|uniref:UDP-N-acetylglucosamine--peptide N-acetylglucosaminyltransferase stabilizing protein GtfB n=1 Tax=Mammaliicoccus sciuri TaxID=1296 RepID=A0AB37HQC7_MAMSC|nr:accessory Sec system glycosylation chaperone GtfB [Mammaliicoccus sciuri]MEB7408313.1 accessory Sec system glycosylation chaperone GtfB [Mammaliicoccus sciuri]QRN91317.1 accessory Sec system glycosylation chaperone GtfB [Mammaliicoccus sciuri]
MINLFEVFDKKAIVLYKSFQFSGINRETIVIEEDGFLPEGISTPYQFFANNGQMPIKPLFFNQVEIPRFWMIEANNESAVIKNLTDIKARIIYKKNYKFRIVERIEWLNNRGYTQYIDYYNQYGFRYAQVLLDEYTHRRVLKHFFNYKGDIVMTENVATNNIILNWNDQTYIFQSKIQFMQFYLKATHLENNGFLINSLSLPMAVISGLNTSAPHCLFWQDEITVDTIRHMENLLSREQHKFKIAVSGHAAYKQLQRVIDTKWHDKIIESGYVYKFIKQNKQSNQVLTLTNSDQLPHIEELVKEHPQLDFHIAAITEMSNVLLNLDQYSNVKLYPNAKRAQFTELYKTCDIYLDINRGNEILDAVRAAFDYQLLILGYQDTAHNTVVTAPTNLFNLAEPKTLSQILLNVSRDTNLFIKHLDAQLQQGASIEIKTFKNTMNIDI